MELHIVDGTNMLHRAYHAMPKLTNSKGKPVGALQGLINTMLSLHKLSPNATHRVCVFDPPGGSSMRKEAFDDYKGNRGQLEDDLALQSKPARKAVKSLGWGVLEVPGVEADDVIATLTERFTAKHKKGAKVVIHSGDKDMMQLIDKAGAVAVNNPIKKEVFDYEKAREVWGVDPWLIPQVQALIGDSIDNIPGCKGVGIETAKKLFAEHGDLKGIMKYARTVEKQSAVVKKLLASEAEIKLSLKLARLQRDLDFDGFKWRDYAAARIDRESGMAFCKKWELKALTTRLMTA